MNPLQLFLIIQLAKAKFINLNGIRLRVVCVPSIQTPYFTARTQDNATSYSGAEVDLLKYIAIVLNFTFTMISSVDGKYGVLENGKWNGMIGMLARNEADIAIGDIAIKTERAQVVDFSWPFMIDGTCLQTHSPINLPLWKALAWPFHTQVWFCILGTFVFFSIFIVLFIKSMSTNYHFSILDGFLFSMRSLLNQMQGIRTQILHVDITIIFWLMYCFILCATFSGSLISALTVPKKTKPLNTFKELADSDYYELRVRKGTVLEYVFRNSTDPVFQKIDAKWHAQDEKYEMEDQPFDLISHPWAVTLGLCSLKVYSADISLPTGESYVHVSKDYFLDSGAGHPIQKGAPYLKDYNILVKRALYFGLYKKWMDDSLQLATYDIIKEEKLKDPRRMTIENHIKSLQDVQLRVLNLDMLQSSFYMLLFGIGLSSMAFTWEMMYQFWARNYRDK